MIERTPLHARFGVALLLAAASVHPLLAQGTSTVTVPNGTATIDASGFNTLPWGRAQNGPARVQFFYDASHFTAQGVTLPIEIQRLRFRANGSAAATWAGGVYANVIVGLGYSATDASSPTTNFGNNQGAGYTTVYNASTLFLAGSVTAGQVGPTVIDLPLSTPFVYDPSAGDLLLDIDIPRNQWTGTTVVACDSVTTVTGCSRVSATTTYGGSTGTITPNGQGLVVDLDYLPADRLTADFTASATTGASPLAVTFTDTSFTTAAGGVTSWAWDFDNDGLIDSTQQNPTHVFSACGDFTVSLRVNDGVHAPSTKTIVDCVVTDVVVPDFTVQQLSGSTYQFTDASVPPGTSWNWDLDGDQVPDASGPVVTFTYPSSCVATTVTLSVGRNCRAPQGLTKNVLASPGSVATANVGGVPTSGSGFDWPGICFDVHVTNPLGVVICGMSMPVGATSGHVEYDVDVTPGSYVGKDASPAEWRLATYGGFDAPPPSPTSPTFFDVPFATPFYLPPGTWGVSIWVNDFVGTATFLSTGGPQGPFATPDLVLHPNPTTAPGVTRSDWFTGTQTQNRSWNGRLSFTPVAQVQEGGFGFLAAGCDSTYGTSQLHANTPRIGQTLSITASSLPFDAVVMLLGFSTTVSAYGPLPIDLAVLGAPGCPARVADDVTGFVLGTFNEATWNLSVPNSVVFVGVPFYAQGLVFDPGMNAFGFTTSDAGAGVFGL